MITSRTVVLDNEAVQALLNPGHRKHRRALAVVEATVARNPRCPAAIRLLVPTAVRVEAGWNRRAPGAAGINRFRAEDATLDSSAADDAAWLRAELNLSVPDAHLAAVLTGTPGPHAVVTSDVDDVHRIRDRIESLVVVIPV